MNKIVLIDGNNLLYRSYYATAYSGNLMKNSKNFPTNALYGFINMVNKVIQEEKPTHIMVAFDKGKTFRHDKYEVYKAGRQEMPDDLKKQFLVAYSLCEAMGIKHLEIDNYEADDIIGTFARLIDEDSNSNGLIVSSDKDLLQLITDKVTVKLLKSNDYIYMDKNKFFEVYGILDPKKMVDLKALMGDSSDNIPGVKGIGEKTAISLIQKYQDLDGVYQNLDSISKKVVEKLENDRENAYMSYDIATIYKYVPIESNLDDIIYQGYKREEYEKILNELEFYSIFKKMNFETSNLNKDFSYITITNLNDLKLESEYAIYLETLGYNYHTDIPLGVSVHDSKNTYYIPFELLKNSSIFNDNKKKYTYDLKKLLFVFRKYQILIDTNIDDLMLISYLLNKNIKTDIAYLANSYNFNIKFYDKLYGSEITCHMPNDNSYYKEVSKKADFIYQIKEVLFKELNEEEMLDLYQKIELPLSYVLCKMEENGFLIDENYLQDMGQELDKYMQELEQKIYELAGVNFNILSPKQLSDVLFKTLHIPYPKKIKGENYSTSKEILDKLKDKYEIVALILEYRVISKMKSNYIVGLINEIQADQKIHTIYNQTLTRTGRLSSERPNLQNIPIRDELGRLIRKAFIPSHGYKIASFDYSQIELRVFAHMSGALNMINAFKQGIDIHTKTASEIFNVPLDKVTKDMRRKAKAVNFGIIYGISSFGLSTDLGINIDEAKHFINSYLETFPGIKNYMNSLIYDAYKNGYVKTLMNRKRIIEEINNKNYMIRQSGERMALNTPIQGSAADILKKAMIEIDREMTRLNLQSKMLVQVHDELVFEVKEEEIDILKDLVIKIMTSTYKLDVPLEVDYEIGDNWYDAK